MLWFLLIAAVWIIVAVGCHIHRYRFYEKRPYLKNRRGEGLIALSERQYWWVMTLWPVAIIAAICLCVGLGLLAVLEIGIEWWGRKRAAK